MQTGSETWKWGVVFILLAIFLITANQAYQHVTSQEHYEPPDDYMKGDSWDIEHHDGPGAGQALELPAETQTDNADSSSASASVIPEGDEDAAPAADDIDWNQLKDPSSEATKDGDKTP